MLLLPRDAEIRNIEVDFIPNILVQKPAADEKILDLVISDDRPGHGETRHDRSHLEQIWMVAHLAELHETVDDTEEVATRKTLPRLGSRHKVVIKKTLTLGQTTRDDVLVLARQLFLDFALESSQ